MPRPSSPCARPVDATTVTEPPTSVGKVYPPFLRSAFVLLCLSAFVPFVIVGLRAVVMSAFVPLCLSAFVPFVIVGLRAVVFCRFWKPPRVGEVVPKF